VSVNVWRGETEDWGRLVEKMLIITRAVSRGRLKRVRGENSVIRSIEASEQIENWERSERVDA